MKRQRMTVELPLKVRKKLEILAKEKETNLTEIIHRSILIYDYLNQNIKDGKKIQIDNEEIIMLDFI